jgi:hypothetical protein
MSPGRQRPAGGLAPPRALPAQRNTRSTPTYDGEVIGVVPPMRFQHLASGRTEAGRRLTFAFIYQSTTRTAIPINAWENR